MSVERPEPHTFEEIDEQTIEDTILNMVDRCKRDFGDENLHHLGNHVTNAEAFALSTVAALAYKHLQTVYNNRPGSPPIHLAVADDVDRRYRANIQTTRNNDRFNEIQEQKDTIALLKFALWISMGAVVVLSIVNFFQ